MVRILVSNKVIVGHLIVSAASVAAGGALGGLFLGWFSPTEAGAVGTASVLVFGRFIAVSRLPFLPNLLT